MTSRERTLNIPSELEREHSKRNTLRIARWIGSDPARFALLMSLVLNGERMIAQRASWVMSHSIEQTPALAAPWIDKMIRRSCEQDIHNAVQRNIIRSLQLVEIPKRLRGIAVNVCIGNIQSVHSPIAVKACSMVVLTNIAMNEPDLKREIHFMLEPLLLHDSGAVKASAKKALKRLRF